MTYVQVHRQNTTTAATRANIYVIYTKYYTTTQATHLILPVNASLGVSLLRVALGLESELVQERVAALALKYI